MVQLARLGPGLVPIPYGTFSAKTPPAGPTYAAVAGRYQHTAARWHPATVFTFEAQIKATTGTVYARLYDLTDSLALSGSTLSTTSVNYVLLTVGSLSFTDGHVYEAQLGTDTGAGVAKRLEVIASVG